MKLTTCGVVNRDQSHCQVAQYQSKPSREKVQAKSEGSYGQSIQVTINVLLKTMVSQLKI